MSLLSEKAIRPMTYLKLSNEEIEANTVDCATCPISMLCEAGEASTGFVCGQCGSTAVGVEAENVAETENVYYVDCGAHNFPSRNGTLEKGCDMCNGKVMKAELNGASPVRHVLRTVHSKVSIDDRRRVLAARNREYTKRKESQATSDEVR